MHVNIHKYICVLHLFLKNHLCLLLMVYSLTLLVKWVIPLNACFMAVLQDLFFSEKHLHLKPLTFPISSKNFFTSWNKSFSERGINWHLAICTLPNGQMWLQMWKWPHFPRGRAVVPLGSNMGKFVCRHVCSSWDWEAQEKPCLSEQIQTEWGKNACCFLPLVFWTKVC